VQISIAWCMNDFGRYNEVTGHTSIDRATRTTVAVHQLPHTPAHQDAGDGSAEGEVDN
jgi:hypothetical protein